MQNEKTNIKPGRNGVPRDTSTSEGADVALAERVQTHGTAQLSGVSAGSSKTVAGVSPPHAGGPKAEANSASPYRGNPKVHASAPKSQKSHGVDLRPALESFHSFQKAKTHIFCLSGVLSLRIIAIS